MVDVFELPTCPLLQKRKEKVFMASRLLHSWNAAVGKIGGSGYSPPYRKEWLKRILQERETIKWIGTTPIRMMRDSWRE